MAHPSPRRPLRLRSPIVMAALGLCLLTPGSADASRRGDMATTDEIVVLATALAHLEGRYVEPDRFDAAAMLDEALDQAERLVPSLFIDGGADTGGLDVELGDDRFFVPIKKLRSTRDLFAVLAELHVQLAPRLTRSDVPLLDDDTEPSQALMYALTSGVLSTLDPHTSFLPPVQAEELETDVEGEFGGLGIVITTREGKLSIEYALADTPASDAGLRAGDHIQRIDGESTINMGLNEAVSKLRGLVGAPVTIEVGRDGVSEPVEVTIVRGLIKLDPVEYALLDGDIGYISITAFNTNLPQDLVTTLEALRADAGGQLAGLVLDLRGNPGGSLDAAHFMADLFLDGAEVVSTVERGGVPLNNQLQVRGPAEPDYPMVVLVDAWSASASEIVSGALRVHGRAITMGERTFGKGSVQTILPLPDSSTLKLTIASYLIPGRQSIQGVGVPPDIELVPTIAERVTDEDDGTTRDVGYWYWRETVQREADMFEGKSIAAGGTTVDAAAQPSARVRYLRPLDYQRRIKGKPDTAGDFEVQFAREVIAGARSSSRDDLLASAETVAQTQAASQEQDISNAFQALGLDWTAGAAPKTATLDVRVDLGEDGKLIAGERERIALEVTNNGGSPIPRLAALTASDVNSLDQREFFFGHLEPGDTGRFELDVMLPHGHPSEKAPFTVTFRSGDSDILLDQALTVPVQGRPLPDLSWSWTVNGGASPRAGDTVPISLTITNNGKGPTVDAFARLRNKSGRAIDLEVGSLEPGEMRTADGAACAPLPDTTDRYPKTCNRSILPGESWTGEFQLELVQSKPSYELELELGDASAFDYGSIARNSFPEYFAQRERITFATGQTPPVTKARTRPAIEMAEVASKGGKARIQGTVQDAEGVAHVEVWVDEKKVLYQGGGAGGQGTLMFDAEVTLEDGQHTISVLATDIEGVTATISAVTEG